MGNPAEPGAESREALARHAAGARGVGGAGRPLSRTSPRRSRWSPRTGATPTGPSRSGHGR